MTKAEVEEKRLGDCHYALRMWPKLQSVWRSMDDSVKVSVRYQHSQHGNARKTSNAAKPNVMNDFLAFVDSNSQPNSRSADSFGPKFYFVSKFCTVQTPKKYVANYVERVQRSVVGEFCRVQPEAEKDDCSNGSANNWLRKHRPKLAICLHKQDYCDTCAKYQVDVHAKQTTLNRLRQTGSVSEEDQRELEAVRIWYKKQQSTQLSRL